LQYGRNDLKVEWLVEQAGRGGLDDAKLEAELGSSGFLRIEPAHQPSIHGDPSSLGPEQFAAFYFARPLPIIESDGKILEGRSHDSIEIDAAGLVASATKLFLDFGSVHGYSTEQIDQGLWFLFGHPHWLFNRLVSENVSRQLRQGCIESMLVPFRDYYQHLTVAPSAFFMWWDHFRDWDRHPEFIPVCRRVLEQMLALPDKKSQFAALHGFNHLRPDSEAPRIVQRYLDEHWAELTPEEVAWIEMCRDGCAL